jgi:hypothetical protein
MGAQSWMTSKSRGKLEISPRFCNNSWSLITVLVVKVRLKNTARDVRELWTMKWSKKKDEGYKKSMKRQSQEKIGTSANIASRRILYLAILESSCRGISFTQFVPFGSTMTARRQNEKYRKEIKTRKVRIKKMKTHGNLCTPKVWDRAAAETFEFTLFRIFTFCKRPLLAQVVFRNRWHSKRRHTSRWPSASTRPWIFSSTFHIATRHGVLLYVLSLEHLVSDKYQGCLEMRIAYQQGRRHF